MVKVNIAAKPLITYLNLFDDEGKVSVILRTLVLSFLCFALLRVAIKAFIKSIMPHIDKKC